LLSLQFLDGLLRHQQRLRSFGRAHTHAGELAGQHGMVRIAEHRLDRSKKHVFDVNVLAFEVAAVSGLACAKVSQRNADGAPVAIAYYGEDGNPSADAAFIDGMSLWQSLVAICRSGRITVRLAFAAPLAPPGRSRKELACEAHDMIAAMLAVYVVWRARRGNFGAGEPFDLKRFLRATGRSLWALGAPVIILGGIYGGVFSPTEAAAVACVYAALVTALVFRELRLRDIVEAAAATVLFTGQILIIVACAGVFAWLLTVNQVPATMTAWLQSLNVSAWMLLLAINILLLLVGCFLDPLSAILLLSPLLVPLVKAAGIDTVHFGIVVTVNLAIGLFHPPFGINIFVAQSVLGLKLETIYRGIIPFVIIYLVALALITYIPDISLIGVRYLLARG